MGFNMSKEAKRYFNRLTGSKHGKLKTQFDFYYLCLIAGFKNETFSKCKGEKFVDEFPSDFLMQREQIIGLLIATEINRNKIDMENRERIERLMLKLVKPDSPTQLSNDGESLMNDYAENGFRRILEEIPSPPTNLDTFLVRYYEKVLCMRTQNESKNSP